MEKDKKGQLVPGNQEGQQNQGNQANRDNQRNERDSAEKPFQGNKERGEQHDFPNANPDQQKGERDKSLPGDRDRQDNQSGNQGRNTVAGANKDDRSNQDQHDKNPKRN